MTNAEQAPRQVAKNQQALDLAAALCKDATDRAAQARHLATEKPAQDAASASTEASMGALNLLLSIGAAMPFQDAKSSTERLDLSALAMMADPDAPELLALLEQAQAVAERIDLRRGRAVAADIPLAPGESRGTDLAESISEIALRVRVEVQGPVGRD